MDVRDRLITALDYPTFDQAKVLVEELGDAVTFYKVGMELFYGAGPDIIRYLKDRNNQNYPYNG
jgi:orotidine-5'-phosphate decarboxylase